MQQGLHHWRGPVDRVKRLGSVALALGALAAADAGAGVATVPHTDLPAASSGFRVRSGARLYAAGSPGYTTAYVVFCGSQRLAEPRTVLAEVAGSTGRTYSYDNGCYRSRMTQGHYGAPHLVRVGVRYRVRFLVRSGVAARTRRFVNSQSVYARRLETSPPPRPALPGGVGR